MKWNDSGVDWVAAEDIKIWGGADNEKERVEMEFETVVMRSGCSQLGAEERNE